MNLRIGILTCSCWIFISRSVIFYFMLGNSNLILGKFTLKIWKLIFSLWILNSVNGKFNLVTWKMNFSSGTLNLKKWKIEFQPLNIEFGPWKNWAWLLESRPGNGIDTSWFRYKVGLYMLVLGDWRRLGDLLRLGDLQTSFRPAGLENPDPTCKPRSAPQG